MPSPLDALICFSLYAASHATSQAYAAVLKPWRLTYPQFLVLTLLAHDDRTVGELGAAMHLDSGTLSPLLSRLQRRGLVSRQRASADERVVSVTLTASGREIAAEVTDAVTCLVPAYRVTEQQVPEVLALLRGIELGMHELRTELANAVASPPAVSDPSK